MTMINVFVLMLGFLVACGDKDEDTAVEVEDTAVEPVEEEDSGEATEEE